MHSLNAAMETSTQPMGLSLLFSWIDSTAVAAGGGRGSRRRQESNGVCVCFYEVITFADGEAASHRHSEG